LLSEREKREEGGDEALSPHAGSARRENIWTANGVLAGTYSTYVGKKGESKERGETPYLFALCDEDQGRRRGEKIG